MDPSWLFTESLSGQAMLLVLGSTRIAMAFIVLPLLSADLVPAMSRNSLYVMFGMVALALQPAVDLRSFDIGTWLLLFAKEMALGATLGFVFGSVLWAFEAAGQFIDGKAGTTASQVNDPMSGQQVSLTGLFFVKLAGFVFMFSGGLLLLVATVMESYSLWPLLQLKPISVQVAMKLLENEFNRVLVVALLVSAPVIVTLFAIDLVLGLINRFAPQLNLFSLAASAKVWASSLVILLMLTSLVQQLLDDIFRRPAITLRALEAMFPR
ncbi:MAG: type III secretion system export apparatus subunit SctT [Cytophagales bacterium]|nr:type III secretion system export apparatus subunit SctT [Rhizobacter sp.]